MAARVFVERGGDGRLVVRKVPLDAGADLATEAAWLRRAAGPGVVQLVSDEPAVGGLTTLHGGAHTWRTAGPGPPQAAALLAGVLRTAAELHRRQLVHGAIGPDHVLVGADGPMLCSPRPGIDPAEDRAALADLAEGALERWRDSGTVVPAAAAWQRAVDLLRRQDAGWSLDDIAGLLDPRDGGAPSRTGARVGTAPRRGPLTGRVRWRRPGSGSPGAPRPVVLGACLAAAAAAALALVDTGPARPAADPDDPGARSGTPRAAGSEDALDPVVTSGNPAPATGQGRYRADGAEGVLATASAACAGTPPAALLAPDTGEVWAFATLPPPHGQTTGVPVGRVPGADRLDVRPDGNCQRIVAVGPAGEAFVPAAGDRSGAGVTGGVRSG